MKNQTTLFILFICLFASTTINAQYASLKKVSNFKRINKEAKKHNSLHYNEWSYLLRKNASVFGAIDYTGFKKYKSSFDDVLIELSNTKIDNNWSNEAQIAHWINVYNAYSVKMIVNHFPLRKLSDVKKPTKQKFFEINGKITSLDDLESSVIADFKDPRIFFVLNRGTISGAQITKNAYTAENLETLINKRVKLFFNDKNHIKIASETVTVSHLVSTYKKEIENVYGSLKSFINTYSSIQIKDQKIEFMDNDDTINSFQQVID